MDEQSQARNVDPVLDADDAEDGIGLGDAAKSKDDADFIESGTDF
jgi:hypothetical protein